MNKKLNIVLIIFMVLCLKNTMFSQDQQCYEIDWQKMIAYCKNDTAKLYSGECKSFYRNGKLKSKSLVKNGVILYSMLWKKNGTLLDSIISLDSLGINMEHYIFFRNGNLFLKQTMNRETTKALDIFYTKKGRKRVETNYSNWVRNGLQIFYNKKGEKISEETYIDNKFVNPAYEWKNSIKYEVQYNVSSKIIGSKTLEFFNEISRKKIE